MDKLRADLQYAWRTLLRRRAYFFACSVTLALVLGATAAIFAAMSATILRPMPFRNGARVVHLFMQPPGLAAVSARNPLQQMDIVRFRERARTMTRFEGYLPGDRVVTLQGAPTVVPSAAVTPGLLDMVDAAPQAGRLFSPDEGKPGQNVAIVTEGFWRRVLGGAPIIGAPLVIDSQPHTIVGILKQDDVPAFLRAEIVTPFAPDPAPLGRTPSRSVITLAELAPGTSIEAASDEVRELMRQLAVEFPRTHGGWTGGAQSVRQWLYNAVRTPLLILFAAAGVVVLIACANLTNLASGQASARTGDLSLRLALGATRADILRLQTLEMLIIVCCGLAPGLLLAAIALGPLLAIDPAAARALGPVAIDWRVLAFTATAAVATAVAAAILPTVQTLRGRAAGTLSEGYRVAGSREARRLRRALVCVEVALCLALLIAGGALLRSLAAAARTDPGYDPRGVLTGQIRLPDHSYGTLESRASFATRLLESVRAVPGVESASTTMNRFVPGLSYQLIFHVEKRPTPNGEPHVTQFRRVSPGYFSTMRIRTLAGRTFTDGDRSDTLPVAVVSRLFAEQLFAGEEAIGQRLRRTVADAPPITIVGVVDDVRDVSVTQVAEATLYLPWSQNNNTAVPLTLVARTGLDPDALLPAVRAAVAAVDPSIPLRDPQPLQRFVDESIGPERFRATVLGLLAMLGLTLAALGIYGVTYRGVVERTHEFAVRLALGGERVGVIRLVLGEASRDLALGAAVGLLGGLLLTGVLQRLIANAGAMEAGTTAAAMAVLAVATLAAALIPALRILRVQPADALAQR